ncbi:MAG: hypothetical protein V2I46_01910 [Bacteroides sp.]|jgi:hypothetical protein|nr:hypothetical protein [Bacteroides sp.]
MEESPEEKRTITKRKGSGFRRLILFSIISFAVCFAAVYFLTRNRNRKIALKEGQEFNTGYFEGNKYTNPDLGWQINFPEGMTLLDNEHLKDWNQLPQVPGFAPDSIGDTGLFLALGDAFSVVAYASVEALYSRVVFQTNEQIITQTQQRLRQSITARNAYPCDCEVSDVLIDQVPFKRMSLEFIHEDQVQKRQEVFSAVTGNHLLHVTVVYYNVLNGEKLITAIQNSVFEKQDGSS